MIDKYCLDTIVKYNTILCTVLERQVENLTRGWEFRGRGGETPVGAMSTYSLYSYSSISGGKIENLGANIFWRPKSKIAAHN